ncbi:LIM/homeobox protein Lhx2-like [Daphnia carinata]|uniref:LIM/homeobox protein Lhx2-like n=1 Tax=Daphnia carinata TaxID=120202 RepID=UPI00257EE75B|nr:LIM/homeobox protein Lhx2-like [Daphnia carinata]
MPVMSTESAGDDQQATAVTIKHESSASMHQLLSNSVAAATASSGGGLGSTIGGIVGSEHSPSPTTLCGGCGFKITDRYYLVAVERAWHSECLRCGECRRPLDTALSCFARQSRIYCRDDYYRLFGVRRCNRCCLPLGSNELVMRARDAVFHLACFTCAACNQPLTKGDIFGMRDGIVYCRLHYEMLQHPTGSLGSTHQPHQHGLIMPHQHIQGNNNGLMGSSDGPCDLSSCGPHHGLLPPSGFHHPHHLIPPESVSPSQHMINILSSASIGDPAVDASYPSGMRPNVFGGSVAGGGQDYLHNPSVNDFQRCLGGSGSAVSSFFPSLSGGLGNAGLGGSSPSAGSMGHHHSVQKGRPRKRKIPAAAAAVTAAAALAHSGNNNNNGNVGGSTGNHADSSILGQQQHLNAANLRQLTAGIDMLGSSADLSSMEGMVYDSSGTNGSASGGGGGGSSSQQQQQQQRTKRMRTSFKHHQLRTMKSYFAINQNPDAKDLKQLAQKTGLSKRVLQVWFQNARAKWRRNIMRQQDGGGSGGGGGVGGGGGGAGGTSSIKDGDLLTASASSSQLEQQQQHPHHHHHHQQPHQPQQPHRVSASLGELTPPGSAGGMTHSSAVSNEDASSNLVFSDLY